MMTNEERIGPTTVDERLAKLDRELHSACALMDDMMGAVLEFAHKSEESLAASAVAISEIERIVAKHEDFETGSKMALETMWKELADIRKKMKTGAETNSKSGNKPGIKRKVSKGARRGASSKSGNR